MSAADITDLPESALNARMGLPRTEGFYRGDEIALVDRDMERARTVLNVVDDEHLEVSNARGRRWIVKLSDHQEARIIAAREWRDFDDLNDAEEAFYEGAKSGRSASTEGCRPWAVLAILEAAGIEAGDAWVRSLYDDYYGKNRAENERVADYYEERILIRQEAAEYC